MTSMLVPTSVGRCPILDDVISCLANPPGFVVGSQAASGVILGMSNVLLIPAICHLKLIATTKLSKSVDTLSISI